MDIWAIPTSVILSGVLVFLLRNWISSRIKDSIKHEYDCKLELIRAEAKLENELKLESIKQEFSFKLAEAEIKTNWLQQRMANEIEEIYKLLWTFRKKVSSYVTIIQGPEYKDSQKIHEMINAFLEFQDNFNEKRIFFPRKTVQEIENFMSILRNKYMDFHRNVVREQDSNKEIDNWTAIDNYMNNEANQLFEILEENFRDLLGHYNIEKHITRKSSGKSGVGPIEISS